MKTLILSLAAVTLLCSACSKSREDQIKEVCDCFKEAKTPMECFKMQHEYSTNYEGEERTKFLQETNACAN